MPIVPPFKISRSTVFKSVLAIKAQILYKRRSARSSEQAATATGSTCCSESGSSSLRTLFEHLRAHLRLLVQPIERHLPDSPLPGFCAVVVGFLEKPEERAGRVSLGGCPPDYALSEEDSVESSSKTSSTTSSESLSDAPGQSWSISVSLPEMPSVPTSSGPSSMSVSDAPPSVSSAKPPAFESPT